MKKLVTMKMDAALLHRLDSHLSSLGVDRTSFITSLVENHLQTAEGRPILAQNPTWVKPKTPEISGAACVLSERSSYYHAGKTRTAAHMAFPGVVPENTQVFHTCDAARCINTKHLYLGENNQKPRRWVHMVLAFPKEYTAEVLESAILSNNNIHGVKST